MNIIRYKNRRLPQLLNPFDRLAVLHDEMDRWFDGAFLPVFFRTAGSAADWTPALDVYQDKDQFTVVAELPGLKKEDIKVSIEEGALTISGERKQEQESQDGYRSERFHGRFQRTVSLPSAIDNTKVTATYQDGLLKVVLPKAEEAKPKQIEVSIS